MSFETPDDLRYLETHEWARVDDADESAPTARIGITDFAQDELGDVVFVELPEAGETLTQHEQFGVIESIKAVSDLYAPVSGTVTAVNEALFDEPELVNEDPYGDGWMLELEGVEGVDDDALLDPDAYADQID
jgi:glycine cleavage system H protein